MSTAVYWSLFAAAAVLMLVVVLVVARRRTERSQNRDFMRLKRRERSEQARRRIRLGL
jgi:hypothetical protein